VQSDSDPWVVELLELEPVAEALAVARDAGVPEEQIRKFCVWAAEEPHDGLAEPILGGRLLAAAKARSRAQRWAR
jgi:hypothetical protein